MDCSFQNPEQSQQDTSIKQNKELCGIHCVVIHPGSCAPPWTWNETAHVVLLLYSIIEIEAQTGL